MRSKIIRSLLMNYPVICRAGVAVDRAVVLIPPPGKTRKMLDFFKTSTLNAPLVVGTNIKDWKLEKWMTCYRSQAVFFVPSGTKKSDEILAFFSSATQTGYVSEKKVTLLPVVITENIYLVGQYDFFSIAFEDFECEKEDIECLNQEVLPNPDEIPRALTLYDELQRTRQMENEYEKALTLAATLICAKDGNRDLLDAYLVCVKRMIADDEEFHYKSGLDELFLERFLRWQKDTEFGQIQKLPDIEIETSVDETIFYDEKYLFISESLFKKVVEPMSIPINILKTVLADEDILVPEKANQRAYVVKMFYSVDGESKRKRMLRFDRTKLTRAGDLDFIDACKTMGG